MSLTLYFHPLSSFCQKVLVGLYELGVPFEKKVVDLSDPSQRAELRALWPMGKFPVIRDHDAVVPESSSILEHVDARFARTIRLVPSDPDVARRCRLRDRFFDLYVNATMGKVVTDRLRPAADRDPFGVTDARAQLEAAYAIADDWLKRGPWAAGDAFTIADCAAAPALFFAATVTPFADRFRNLEAYYGRLVERPSVARVLDEAKPYLSLVPR